MTAATAPTAPWPSSAGVDYRFDGCLLLKGGWTFLPRPASAPEARAFLRFRGNNIELLYSATDFEGFLAEMSEIQVEFDRLCTGESATVRHRDWVGQTRYV